MTFKKLDRKDLSEIYTIQIEEDSPELTSGESLYNFYCTKQKNEFTIVGSRTETFKAKDIFLYSSKKIINPPNNSVVVNTNEFKLSLYTKSVEDKSTFGAKPWEIFYTDSLKAESAGFTNKNGHFYQKFIIKPQKDRYYGMLQLKCNIEIAQLNDDHYVKDEIYTIFFASHDRIKYPPMVPVMPYLKQTWVPLIKGQELQVISSVNEIVTPHSENVELQHHVTDTAYDNEHIITYYNLSTPPKETNVLIIEPRLKKNNKSRKVICIPEIKNGSAIISLVPDLDTFSVFCYGLEGLIVRTTEPLRPKMADGYLDDDCNLYMKNVIKCTCRNNGVVYYDQYIDINLKNNPLFTTISNLFNPKTCVCC